MHEIVRAAAVTTLAVGVALLLTVAPAHASSSCSCTGPGGIEASGMPGPAADDDVVGDEVATGQRTVLSPAGSDAVAGRTPSGLDVPAVRFGLAAAAVLMAAYAGARVDRSRWRRAGLGGSRSPARS